MIQGEKQKSPLSDREIEEADDRSSTTAKVIHEAIRLEGTEELERPASSIGWSGLAAGLTISCSMLGQGILQALLPDAAWRELVSSFGYCTGFYLRHDGPAAAVHRDDTDGHAARAARDARHKRRASLLVDCFCREHLRYIAVRGFVDDPRMFPPDVVRAFTELGTKAVEPGFLAVLIKAVFAGWLIALMVWLLPAASGSRFFVIIAVTWLIGVAHFSHVIAGSAETAFAAMHGAIGWQDYLLGFLLPAFLGNSIGGVVFVALLNHAQVKAEV